jgi:Na+-driven multidrug efflux pump
VAVVPLALGCGLYPGIGIAIFGEAGFAPAAANLRVLAAHVFLLYFSMTLGCCLSAAGRQRPWALAQLGCVAVAGLLDLLLVPWFQAHAGNGGLGVAVSLVACELLMLAVALALAPRGLVDAALGATFLRAGLAGLALAGVAYVCRDLPALASAALAGLAYAAVLAAAGGLGPAERAALRRIVRR